MIPKKQHANQKLCNAHKCEQSHSQVAEINPVQVAAHRARCNNQEHGRSQQLGNENCERLTLYDRERRQSQYVQMTPAQMAANQAQRNNQERGRAQKIGNEKHERCTQNEAFRVAYLNSIERSQFNFQNASNQRT